MCLYSYHEYFILSQKSERHVTGRNKSLNLWSLFIDWRNQFLIPTDWIIENDLCQILRVFCMSCPNSVKHLWPVQRQLKESNRVNFDLPKGGKININFELLKVSKKTSLKIYVSPVMEKLETSNLDSRWTSVKGFHWVLRHMR